ncbi:MAG: phosphoglycerate dehydrogenase [Candidatus Nealsonbacteria bacterium]
MSKILITTSSFGKTDQGPLEKLKKGGFEIIQNPYGRKVTSQELRELLPGVLGLIAGTETIDRETLKNSGLKVISRVGVGIDSIDLEAAKELGIVVKNTPEAPTVAVAELALGGILALLRQIPQMDQEIRQKVWDKKTGVQLSGKTVLIIGFGRIGRYLAKMLAPFNVKLITVDPSLPGISLQTALPQADIICLHASGIKQILGASEFALMKNGVFLVNTARGELWDENALIEALRSGKVAGAFIDVFSKEPYAGPLTEIKQVILTAHIGSNTKESRVQMEKEAVDNLLSCL